MNDLESEILLTTAQRIRRCILLEKIKNCPKYGKKLGLKDTSVWKMQELSDEELLPNQFQIF